MAKVARDFWQNRLGLVAKAVLFTLLLYAAGIVAVMLFFSGGMIAGFFWGWQAPDWLQTSDYDDLFLIVHWWISLVAVFGASVLGWYYDANLPPGEQSGSGPFVFPVVITLIAFPAREEIPGWLIISCLFAVIVWVVYLAQIKIHQARAY